MKLIFQRHQPFFSIVIIILGAGWIGFTSIYFPSTTNGFIPAPKEGFLAPDFSLQDPTGTIYILSDMRGRAVLVNIWTSWCPPCKAEMPAIQKVYEEYKEQGFIVLAVNATYQDNLTNATQFAVENRLSFPILVDRDGSTSQNYQVRSFPSSYFIDKEGVIQEVVIGGPMAEALLRTRVQMLIDEGDE